MEDLKKHIFPLIAAIAIHGIMVGFKLPKQQTLQPTLSGDPIKIELNAFSPKAIIPDNSVHKKEQIIQKEIAPQKTVKRTVPESADEPIEKVDHQVVQDEVISQPIFIAKKPQKRVRKQKQNKHEASTEERIENKEPQNREFNELLSDNVYKERQIEKEAQALLRKKAMPIYRQNKQPPYPVMAKRRGYEGEVLLSVLVDAGGMVAEIEIKHSSGHLSLDRAALETVKSWSFIPATEGGRPFSMWVDVPIEFQLK